MSKATGAAKTASWVSIVLMVAGAVFILAGGVTWVKVSSTLSEERITVSEDACMGGAAVNNPLAAYCQAMIIQTHALEATGGKTYAELDRDDPLRTVAMNGSFLRSSLFTSVVAFGVAAMAAGLGVLFILVGVVVRSLGKAVGASAGAPEPQAAVAA